VRRRPVITDAHARKKRLWPQQLAAELPCGHIARLTDRVLRHASATLPVSQQGGAGSSAAFTSHAYRQHAPALPGGWQLPSLPQAAAAGAGEQLDTRAACAACRAMWLRATMLQKHLEPSLPNADGSFWKLLHCILVRSSVLCRADLRVRAIVAATANEASTHERLRATALPLSWSCMVMMH
jgi:hypothetical protein